MKSDISTYKRLANYLTGKVWYFVLAIVGYLLAAGSEVVFAQTLGAVVDIFQDPASGDSASPPQESMNWVPEFVANIGLTVTVAFPLLIVCTAIFRALGTVAGEALLSRVSLHVVHTVRCNLFDRLLVLPSFYYDANKQGAISNRLTDTTSKLRDTVTDVLKIGIQDGGKLLVFLYTLLAVNAALTGIFITLAPVVAVVVKYASRRFRRISQRIQSSMGEVTQVGQESANAYKLIRAYGGEEQERARFARASESNRKQNLKMVATKAASTQLIQLVVALSIGLLVGVLFIPEVSGDMTTGDLVTYITIAGLLASPIKRLSDLNSRIQTGLAAADDIFAQIDHEAESDDGTLELESVNGEVVFKNVSFKYPSSERLVLDDFSLCVQAGETVAIVGTTGSGKSTITELLMGFYEPTRGEISLDGHRIDSLTKKNLRQQLALVSQDVFLFNDTLRSNIAYGSLAAANSKAIDAVVKQAHVDEFIDRLPEGLDSTVGDRGLNLSQGQRQRIAIARALLKNAPVLILDEATSSLDTETESVLQKVLSAEMRDRTMIVVAHRLSTVENADRIVVLEEGKIVEEGTHGELLKAGGRYAFLYRSNDKLAKDAPQTNRTAPMGLPIRSGESHSRWYDRLWYEPNNWSKVLMPISWLFGFIVKMRRRKFRTTDSRAIRAKVPVIVVGNITVGGTGKTPLVIFLARWLSSQGKRVGVVMRGYGVRNRTPRIVDSSTAISESGDEAPVVADRTGCPVMVGTDRVQVIGELVSLHDVELIVSDDGLQHYSMARDVEIAVVDGERRLGNGLMLPAGPLREPASRLEEVDCVVFNGGKAHDSKHPNTYGMQVTPIRLVHVQSKESVAVADATKTLGTTVFAYSAIGNPERFLRTLAQIGFEVNPRSFPDHASFRPSHFKDLTEHDVVVVTEKDWRRLVDVDIPTTNLWYLEVEASFESHFENEFTNVLARHGITFP